MNKFRPAMATTNSAPETRTTLIDERFTSKNRPTTVATTVKALKRKPGSSRVFIERKDDCMAAIVKQVRNAAFILFFLLERIQVEISGNY
jgi:hypothetical protein